MGYDVYSRNGDAAKAVAFAKKWEYGWMFDEQSNFKGDDRVYFRQNIWGMGKIRQYLANLAAPQGKLEELDPILKKFSWNDGDWVTRQECAFIADLIELSAEPFKKSAAAEVLGEGDTEEGLNFVLGEFADYLRICYELDGCLVY